MSIVRGTLTAFPLVSNLASLGSAAAKPLGVIDLSGGYHGVIIYIQLTLAAAAVSSTGYVDVYLMTSEDNTNWTDAISPSTTSDIASSVKNCPLLFRFRADANNQVVKQSVGDIVDRLGILPKYLSLIVTNNSGAALASSGHDAKYSTILYS